MRIRESTTEKTEEAREWRTCSCVEKFGTRQRDEKKVFSYQRNLLNDKDTLEGFEDFEEE